MITPFVGSCRCYVHRSECLTYQVIERDASYAHRSVPTGLRWAYDGVGEGAARPAPRQGRTRAHPQRFTTTVPRSRHQRHRHGPALRGGRGVQAHALPALRRQGRADRRTPTPIRSRHPARGVRPHRPHTPRTTPRRLRHPRAPVPVHRGGRRDPRPGPPGTRATPATTRRPLRRGSPKPPARPAPPTPSSSASNWRCSWMAPRPAAESSTPTPSPPPPPSQSSSSTTPSPRQRYRPAQAGTCQPGRRRARDPAASSAEVDAEGEVEAPHAIAGQAHRQQARSLQPVRHAQVAGVPRAQPEALDER